MLAACLIAMPAKVSITPNTVPSSPMNGPPATAVLSTIMPFSRPIASALAVRSSTAFTRSKEPWLILVEEDRASTSVWPRSAALPRPLGRVPTSMGLFLR